MEYHLRSRIILANHRIDHEYHHKSIQSIFTNNNTVIGLLTSSTFPSSINISRSLSQTYFTSLSFINSQFRNYTSFNQLSNHFRYQSIDIHSTIHSTTLISYYDSEFYYINSIIYSTLQLIIILITSILFTYSRDTQYSLSVFILSYILMSNHTHPTQTDIITITVTKVDDERLTHTITISQVDSFHLIHS